METLVEGIKKCVHDPHYANTDAGRNYILDGVKQVVEPEMNGNSLDGSNINVNIVVPSLKSNDIQAQAQSQKCGGGPKTYKKPVYKNVTVYKKKKQERYVKVPCGTKKVLCGYEDYCVEEPKCKPVCKPECKKVCCYKKYDSCSSSSYRNKHRRYGGKYDSCSSSYKIVCKKGCKNVCYCVKKRKDDCPKYEKVVECKPQMKCEEKVRPVHKFKTRKTWVYDGCPDEKPKHNDKFLNPDKFHYKSGFKKPCAW